MKKEELWVQASLKDTKQEWVDVDNVKDSMSLD